MIGSALPGPLGSVGMLIVLVPLPKLSVQEMKRSSWRKRQLERRKDKVESGFLLCKILATNLGVYPTCENLPAGGRDGLVMG